MTPSVLLPCSSSLGGEEKATFSKISVWSEWPVTSANASWILFNTAWRSVKAYVLRWHLLHSVGAPRQTTSRKRWHQPLSFHPCNQPLTLNASDHSSNGSSEKERNFAQKKPNTLHRSSSVSQLNIAFFATWSRAAQAADNVSLKTGMVSLAPVNLLHRFGMFRGQQLQESTPFITSFKKRLTRGSVSRTPR